MKDTGLILQTRAVISDSKTIADNLKKNDFIKKGTKSIKDIYFANPEDIHAGLHTYEKIGESFRIRIINEKKLLVQQHVDILRKKKKSPSHDVYKLVTLFEGKSSDLKKIKALSIKKGFSQKLIEIAKIRDTFYKGKINIHIDKINRNTNILEISLEISSINEYKKAKQDQLRVFANLGIDTHQIIDDGYTHRKISQYISSTPSIRKKAIQKELKKLIEELRKKEKISGEAYRDTGDGWHENPTYETIWNDILVLNNRIIELKNELNDLT